MKTKAEKRLLVIRAFDHFSSQKSPVSSYEYEIFVDVHAAGETEFGPFKLMAWDAPYEGDGTRSLILEMQAGEFASAAQTPTKKGFFHGVNMPEEFVALACVFLGRRIRLGPVVRMNGTPLRVRARKHPQHKKLGEGEIDISSLSSSFDSLRTLPEIYHQSFLLACRMYQQSVALLEEHPDIAYLLLVSCIEVFLEKYGDKAVEADLDDDIKVALSSVSEPASRTLLASKLLEHSGIARKFSSFILDYMTESFWGGSTTVPANKGKILKDELPLLLKAIYNQRSLTLHAGEPFPPNALEPTDEFSDIAREGELVVDGRRWTKNQFVPYPRFFERLVRHVLLTFLERMSTTQQPLLAVTSENVASTAPVATSGNS